MGSKPSQDQSLSGTAELAEARRKEAEEQKKLEKERIEQERSRFGGGGGSLLSTNQDQKQGLGG